MLNQVLTPDQNQLYGDLALEHEKIIWGAVFNALQEITGNDPTRDEFQKEINKNLGILFKDHKRFFVFQWKGEDIVIVHALEIEELPGGAIKRHRKIEEPWKKRLRFLN